MQMLLIVQLTFHVLQGVSIAPEVDGDLAEAWSQDIEDAFYCGGSTACARFGLRTTAPLVNTPNSIDFAISESVGGDAPLIAAAVAAICVVAIGALFINDHVFSRCSLAALGVLSVCLSVGAGFGIALAIGIPFTSLTQVRLQMLCFLYVRVRRHLAQMHLQMYKSQRHRSDFEALRCIPCCVF